MREDIIVRIAGTSRMVDENRINAVDDAKRRSGLSDYIGPVGGLRGPLYNEHGSKNILFRAYVHFSDSIVWINLVSMIVAAFQTKSVVEFVMVGFPISAESLSLYLSYYSGHRNEEFTDVLLSFDDCFEGDPYPEHLEREIEKSAKYFYTFPRSLICLEVITMEMFVFVFPLTNELMNDYFRPRAVAMPCWYPCSWEESLECFLMILAIHFFGAIYVNWKTIAFDELLYALVSRQVALFRHLNHNLNKLLNTIKVGKDGQIMFTVDEKSDHRYVKKAMKQWIKHHQAVMAQYNRLQELLSWPLFAHFGFVCASLCCSAYATSDDSLDFDANFLCGGFLLGQLLVLFYLCRLGDWITIETNELELALTGVDINILDKEEAKMVSIILSRVNRPSVIRALRLYPLNTATLKVLIQSTYSYYTMLKNVNYRN